MKVSRYRDRYVIALANSKGTHDSPSLYYVRVFEVPYKSIGGELRQPLGLTLVAGSGSSVSLRKPYELHLKERAISEKDLAELAHIDWYISPSKRKKVSQPLAKWTYAGGGTVVACLKGSQKKSLGQWLSGVTGGAGDSELRKRVSKLRKRVGCLSITELNLAYAQSSRSFKAIVPKDRFDSLTPISSLYLFRGDTTASTGAASKARVGGGGAMLHVAQHHTRSTPSSREPTLPDRGGKKPREALPLNEQTELHRLGYKITGTSRAKLWHILNEEAVPRLGLEKVARTIANHCRMRRAQSNGEERFAHAIAEWEHDLARLNKELYGVGQGGFTWPRTKT